MTRELKDDKGITYFTLEHLLEIDTYCARWFGSYLPVDAVKHGALLYLEEMKKKPCSRLLNDNRKLEGVWDEANQWLETEWIPAAIALGLKKFAHIYSPDLYAQLSADFLVENIEKTPGAFQVKIFDSEEPALNWLLA